MKNVKEKDEDASNARLAAECDGRARGKARMTQARTSTTVRVYQYFERKVFPREVSAVPAVPARGAPAGAAVCDGRRFAASRSPATAIDATSPRSPPRHTCVRLHARRDAARRQGEPRRPLPRSVSDRRNNEWRAYVAKKSSSRRSSPGGEGAP